MFRLSQFMREVLHPTPLKAARKPAAPRGYLEPDSTLQSDLQTLLYYVGGY